MRVLRPLVKAINGNALVRRSKNLRNELVDRSFRAAGHGERDRFLRAFKPRSKIVVFSIAYNTPWVIDLLTAAWGQFVKDADLVIVDNSSDRNARSEHRKICDARNIPYLALPKNFEWSPLRSNAIAMNWVYYNVVSKIESSLQWFGFIDHDCFPVADIVFADRLKENAVYGLKRWSESEPEKWYLWAGFCFFRPGLIPTTRFDFKHSYEHRMDTGGRNWWPVYSTLPPDQCVDAGFRTDEIEIDGFKFHEQVIGGSFSHIGGASYRPDFSKEAIKLTYQTYLKQTYFSWRN